ncbi:hypothetical protein [Pseudonocardia kunmingensis]|uniref:Transmembrane protein n=1 Tax=Pseudonocardia kunmingensis TaxID=630975 RepID=A0A543DY91_9PSEU|nr:hypothetical protein [Pseudonocardia kunmingensis]TQM14301.1 hypothetical protein FB558_1063 [Pseudonocardia kunmingensis]
MTEEEKVPDELAALDAELRDAERRAVRGIDPGPTGMVVSVAMLVLIGGTMLPWTGSVHGWEVLAGLAPLGVLPPLFAGTSLGFGLVCSALALTTRWWSLAWLSAVGCGFSVVTGIWAIWSRQIAVPVGATGAGIGLVLSVLAVLVLAASWVRIATRR